MTTPQQMQAAAQQNPAAFGLRRNSLWLTSSLTRCIDTAAYWERKAAAVNGTVAPAWANTQEARDAHRATFYATK
jgi:hypothetical protein